MEYDIDHKTKDYVRRARKNYSDKFDQLNLRLPKGTKDIIREKTGMSVNAYIVKLVTEDLQKNYNVNIE